MFINNKIFALTKKKSFSNSFISILFIFTFLLFFLNKTDYVIASKLKSLGVDIISPVSRIISAPLTYSSNLIKDINDLRFLKSQNLRLKEEIIRLKKWQTLAIKNERENKAGFICKNRSLLHNDKKQKRTP